MKTKADTYHVPLNQKENFAGDNGGNKVYVTKSKKLLLVTFNNRLCFNELVSNLRETAGNKMHALPRVGSYTSWFLYYMEEYNKSLNSQINILYEKALRLIHSDHNLAIEE